MLSSMRMRIMLAFGTVILVTVVILMFFAVRGIQKSMFRAEEESARNLLRLTMLNVENAYKSIVFHENATLERRKSELKNIASLAIIQIETFYQKARKGVLTEAEARRQAIENIKRLRYDNGVGYLWINDVGRPFPRMIMHPTIPTLNGTVLDNPRFNCAFGKEKNLFQAFVDLCLKDSEGYVDYLWPKPTTTGLTERQPKISYVQLFEPWGWIIGTGVYIDDIEKESRKRLAAVLEELNHSFARIRIGTTGYMFLFNGNKEMLIHPVYAGADFSEMKNPLTGNSVIADLQAAANSPAKKLEYLWDKPPDHKGNYTFAKIGFIDYFEPLDWYIGSSVYRDEIEAPAEGLRRTILSLAVVLFIAGVLVSFLLSRSITAPLLKLTGAVQEIEKRGVSAADIPVCGTGETRNLGLFLDKMLASIKNTNRENENLLHDIAEKNEELLKANISLQHEIQERKQIEESLKTSEEKFRGIFEQSYHFIGLLSPEGTLLAANRTSLQSLDIDDVREVIGKPFWETPWWAYSKEEQNRLRESIDAAAHGTFVRYETELLALDERGLFIDFSLKPIRDDAGRITMLIAEGRDVTERKQAQEALQESERKFQDIAKNVPGVVFQIRVRSDGTYYYSYMSPRASELFGLPEEIPKTGWRLEDHIHEEDRQGYCASIEQAIAGHSEWRYQGRMCLGNGKDTWFHGIASPSTLGNQLVFDGILLDITGQKSAEEEKLQLEMQVRQTQKMEAIGMLAGGIAHDFNNILSGIMGYTQLSLEDMKEKPRTYSNMQRVLGAANRAKDLVHQILTFSRRTDHQKQPVHIIPIVKEIAKFLRASLPSTIAIQQSLQTNADCIDADSTQIHQVLMNLCTNAGHAMKEKGGVLEIALDRVFISEDDLLTHPDLTSGHYLKIAISDTGCGIPTDCLDRIFEPYYTTKEPGEGTGLGLAVVHGIVKDHGGDITVYSEVGKGTRFHVCLPLREKASEQPAESDEQSLRGGDEHILFVDDEEDIVDIGVQLLERLGYRVDGVTGASEALEVFTSGQGDFDLVITDKTMPHMTGFDLAEKIRNLRSEVPIIVCTGFGEERDTEACKAAEISDLLIKPLNKKDLAETVRAVLDAHKA